jgi:hypothetical protein
MSSLDGKEACCALQRVRKDIHWRTGGDNSHRDDMTYLASQQQHLGKMLSLFSVHSQLPVPLFLTKLTFPRDTRSSGFDAFLRGEGRVFCHGVSVTWCVVF